MKKKSKRTDPHKPFTQKELDAMGPWMRGIDGLPADMQAAVRKLIGRPPVEHRKEKVTIRLDPEILLALRARGRGWQTQVNAVLHQAFVDGQRPHF